MGGLNRMVERAARGEPATGNAEADEVLRQHPTAILMGILLDQQIRAEIAFSGPLKLKERLGHLDVKKIASMDPEEFRSVFAQRPSVHRFANMMADRVQSLAAALVDQFGGDAGQIWAEDADLKTIEQRTRKLPGFGPNKLKMMKEVLELFGYRHF